MYWAVYICVLLHADLLEHLHLEMYQASSMTVLGQVLHVVLCSSGNEIHVHCTCFFVDLTSC